MNILLLDNEVFFVDVASQISAGKKVRIRAKGKSMMPFIRTGKDEIILQKPLPESIMKGKLLLAKLNDGRYVMHRVERIDNDTIILRGDGNLSAREICTPSEILAEAVAVVRNGKIVSEGSLKWNLYRYLWPRNAFARRVLLAIYRRI